jgi:hypothetical protein
MHTDEIDSEIDVMDESRIRQELNREGMDIAWENGVVVEVPASLEL